MKLQPKDHFLNINKFIKKLCQSKPWYIKFYYFLYRFYDKWISLYTWYCRLCRWGTWLKLGFNPVDVWSLDYTASKWLIPRLKRLKEVKHGHPSGLLNDLELQEMYNKDCYYFLSSYENNNNKEIFEHEEMLWNCVMNKIINAFELVVKDDIEILNEIEENEIEEGLKYFSRYFRALWD